MRGIKYGMVCGNLFLSFSLSLVGYDNDDNKEEMVDFIFVSILLFLLLSILSSHYSLMTKYSLHSTVPEYSEDNRRSISINAKIEVFFDYLSAQS